MGALFGAEGEEMPGDWLWGSKDEVLLGLRILASGFTTWGRYARGRGRWGGLSGLVGRLVRFQ